MQCYSPLRAWQRGAAPPVFSCPAAGADGYRVLEIPCGQCVGCRLEKSRQWATRCMHEAQMHERNCMLTLTYDEASVPADLSLRPRDVQLFLKRLLQSRMRAWRARKRSGEAEPTPKQRFYMCGEYGERNSRPHYHVLYFGFYPEDALYFRKGDSGFKCYTSESLAKIWGFGQVFVGDVSFESAAYVARYVMKKVGSDGVDREILDVTTGEIIHREHEFARMSLNPGIGSTWFEKYASDVFPHDRCIVRGVTNRVPKYYDVLLDRSSPLYLAQIKAKRRARADAKDIELYDAAPPELKGGDYHRLKVHEKVKLASIKSLKRSL